MIFNNNNNNNNNKSSYGYIDNKEIYWVQKTIIKSRILVLLVSFKITSESFSIEINLIDDFFR